MNLKLQDEGAFWAEYQNEPLPDHPPDTELLTAEQIAAKVNGLRAVRGAARLHLPDGVRRRPGQGFVLEGHGLGGELHRVRGRLRHRSRNRSRTTSRSEISAARWRRRLRTPGSRVQSTRASNGWRSGSWTASGGATTAE